mgnify:CR=1 FL=1
MIFNNMDRIVFAGDSVTDMNSKIPVGEGLFNDLGFNINDSNYLQSEFILAAASTDVSTIASQSHSI